MCVSREYVLACVCVHHCTCVGICVSLGIDQTVYAHGCGCHSAYVCVVSICGHVIVVAESVCWCVCVCVSLCPCGAVCTSPGAATPDSCRASREQPPCPPSLLSFIIICHETEPRRMVINKGHLKYETITLTLGNISSVEQLVPPLSSWKGVPGAASPCPAS